MFESICIRPKNETGNLENLVDFGLLAEAMLFYQNVHLIVSQTSLKHVVKKFGADVLLDFLQAKFLKISYLENDTAIYTQNSGTRFERHKPVLFSIPDYAWQKYARKLFAEAIGLTKKGARRYAIQVSPYIKPLSIDRSVEFETLEDFSNGKYIQEAIKYLLNIYVPEYRIPEPFLFDISRNEHEFFVETNINFVEVNAYYHRRIPATHSTLSPAYLLSNIISAQGEWYLASRFSSEIATNEINRAIFSLKFNELLRTNQESKDQINIFQSFVFSDSRTLGESISSGERSFRELYKLLSEAAKFKDWLNNEEPNQQLIQAYFQEVTKKSWVDKLPPKAIRWTLFNLAGIGIDAMGAGGVGKILGLAVSAGDQFLLDKILKGWKPNQFIDKSMTPFVNSK